MKNLNGIKNIIFDFGGVIININPQLTIDEFKSEKYKGLEKAAELFREELFFEELEKGNINEDEFYQTINSFLLIKKDETEIKESFNKLLLDIPENNVDIVKSLESNYRIFLLSNTNIIHYNNYSAKFSEQFGDELRNLFEKAYFSHEIGMRKPDTKIFQKVIEDNNLIPEETLFVDDLIENRETAEELGIKTVEIEMNSGLDSIFNKSGYFTY